MSTSRNLRPFQPGQSGNPSGRLAGSRNKLGEAFLAALHDDFAAHGKAVIEQVRIEKPDQYLKVVASILPRELNITANPMDGWTDEDLEAAIRILDGEVRAQRGIALVDEAQPQKVH